MIRRSALRLPIPLALAAALAACGPATPDDADALAIIGVTVVDVDQGVLVPGRTVVIRGDSIVAAGGNADTPVPRRAWRIDGRDKFLVPGLWDMHVHLSMTGRSALALFLANGVTGVRDMGGSPPVALRWRDSVAAGAIDGPRIVAAGSIVESAGWLAAVLKLSEGLNAPDLVAELRSRLPVASADDAARAVDSLAALGADFVKVRNFPPVEATWALLRAARDRGLPVAAHGPARAYLGLVSDSGVRTLEHAMVTPDGRGGLAETFATISEAERGNLFRRFARNGTAYDPTLVSTNARFVPDSAILRMADDTAGATDPRLRYVSATIRADWRTQVAMRAVDTPVDWRPIYRANLRHLREMATAGVPILAGTDVPVVTLIPGFSVHDELGLMVRDAGLTPAEALRAATLNPAVALGLERGGRVAAGALADLVLLDRNPLADIGATTAIDAVVARGRLYTRADLDRLLDSAAASR